MEEGSMCAIFQARQLKWFKILNRNRYKSYMSHLSRFVSFKTLIPTLTWYTSKKKSTGERISSPTNLAVTPAHPSWFLCPGRYGTSVVSPFPPNFYVIGQYTQRRNLNRPIIMLRGSGPMNTMMGQDPPHMTKHPKPR